MVMMNTFGITVSILCMAALNTDVYGNEDCKSPQYLERGTRGMIHCSFYEDYYGIFWYNTKNIGETESFISCVQSVKDGKGYVSGEYDITFNGSLMIQLVTLEHENTYTVLKVNTELDLPSYFVINVTVTVTPANSYPHVEGCNVQNPCIIDVPREGILTCTVAKIRPELSLEWKQLDVSSPVLFYDQKFTTQEEQGVFNLSLSSRYLVTDLSSEPIFVTCNSFRTDTTIFDRSTEVALKVYEIDPGEVTPAWMIVLFILVSIAFCGITTVAVVTALWKRRNRQNHRPVHYDILDINETQQTTILSNEEQKEDEEDPLLSHHVNRKDAEALKEEFITTLKEAYTRLFNALNPYPYIKDGGLCIDQVFVEGEIQFLPLNTYTEDEKSEWKNMESYKEMFSNSPGASKRKILEADHGYGKSTLTLQFAYDWCNRTSNSFFETVELLILLQLRALEGFSSIYRAIKYTILPKESEFNEISIESIMSNTSQLVIILDSFDEYPDRHNDNDILKTIRKEMFPNALVILTTRPSCLPEPYAELTERFRLTGFGEKAQMEYIERILAQGGHNTDNNFLQIIHGNPVVRDLCNIPCLLAILVQINQENISLQNFYSLTSLFSSIINSFHTHSKKTQTADRTSYHDLLERKHSKLDKAAFNALYACKQNLIWQKDEICEQIGQSFYDQYVEAGILIEDEVIADVRYENKSIIQHIKKVGFCHNIFCEWYAAHYFGTFITNQPAKKKLKNLELPEPLDFPYLYRFSCGLDTNESEEIVQYLKANNAGTFASLCVLEQNTSTGKKKALPLVSVNEKDTLVNQRISIQLLEIASKNEIPINHVSIVGGIHSASFSSENLHLKSHMPIPVLATTEKLSLVSEGHDISEIEMGNILQYISHCSKLKQLEFQQCVIPHTVQNSQLRCPQAWNIKVSWHPRPEICYILDPEDGAWKTEDGKDTLNEEVYENEKTYLAEKRKKQARRQWKLAINATRFISHRGKSEKT